MPPSIPMPPPLASKTVERSPRDTESADDSVQGESDSMNQEMASPSKPKLHPLVKLVPARKAVASPPMRPSSGRQEESSSLSSSVPPQLGAPSTKRQQSSDSNTDSVTTERQLDTDDLRRRMREQERRDRGFRPVLFDDDLKVYTGGHPLILTVDGLERLKEGLGADLELLEDCQVMDYSLLVGIDRRHGTICIGIIDYMRHFDTLKVMESALKGLYQADPTVQPPSQYRKRIQATVDAYFGCSASQMDSMNDSRSALVATLRDVGCTLGDSEGLKPHETKAWEAAKINT